MKRTLALKRDTLTELMTDDLAGVVAAGDPSIGSCPVVKCAGMVTELITGACYTYGCPSVNC